MMGVRFPPPALPSIAMSKASSVQITIAFTNPDLDAEEKNTEAQRLIEDLRYFDEVEAVSRVSDPNPSAHSKSFGGFVIGLLTAEIDGKGADKVLGFLKDRLAREPIEMTVEANGKKLAVKARNAEDLTLAVQAAQEFISEQTSDSV